MCKILYSLVFTVLGAHAATDGDVLRLHGNLLAKYWPYIRPIRNQSGSIEVGLLYTLEMILDLKWRDEILQWNASDYGGQQQVWLKQGDMWLPDITINNRIDSFKTFGNEGDMVLVNSNGDVFWSPQVRIDTRCYIDITAFPFDTQQCSLDMTTAQYRLTEVHLQMENKSIILSPIFQENGGWEVVSTHSIVGQTDYSGLQFSHITLFIVLRRRQSFFVFNTIIPVVILSVLNTAVFTLTPESGEKMTLSITVLLSIGVFLTMITENMPKTSQTVSIMAIYLVILLSVSLAAIFLSALSLSLYRRHPKHNVYPWLISFVAMVNVRNCQKSHPANVSPVNDALGGMVTDNIIGYIQPATRIPPDNGDCTWHDVVTALDRVFFWLFFSVTVVVTTTVLTVMLC